MFDGKDAALLAFNKPKEDSTYIYFENNLNFYNKFTEEQLEANNLVPAFAYSKEKRFLIVKYIGKDFYYVQKHDLEEMYGDKGNNYYEWLELLNKNIEKYLNILIDVVKATKFLHENRIIHCDIKLENILVKFDDEKKRYVGYLTDFDFIKEYLDKEGYPKDFIFADKSIGTKSYLAPELRGRKKYKDQSERCFLYSRGSDKYAFGELILNGFFYRTFDQDDDKNIYRNENVYSESLGLFLHKLFNTMIRVYIKKEEIEIDFNINVYSEFLYEEISGLENLFNKNKDDFYEKFLSNGKIRLVYFLKLLNIVRALMKYKPERRLNLGILIEELNKVKELIGYTKDSSKFEENFGT